MSRAPYALVALFALVVTTAPAQAARCPLVPDAAGDVMPGAQPVPVGPGLSHALDIVGVDVASGAKTVVGVLRVRSLDFDAFTYGYASWALTWQIDGTSYGLVAQRPEDLSGGFVGTFGRGSRHRRIAVKVDDTAATFTWTVPRSWLPELAARRNTFDAVSARTNHAPTFLFDIAGNPFQATPMYTDRTRGCVSAA